MKKFIGIFLLVFLSLSFVISLETDNQIELTKEEIAKLKDEGYDLSNFTEEEFTEIKEERRY